MVSPLSRESLSEDLARGYTLPASWYTDPEILRLERGRIFARTWQYAVRLEQVAEPGDYAACRAGHVPVVVARDREGALRAFVNVCRHRGHEVVRGTGNRQVLQCPYHAWTYGLDGSLRAAPRSDREAGFPKDELGLLPVAIDTWGPFVFVNPDPGAGPFADVVAALDSTLGRSDVDPPSSSSTAGASGP